MNFGDKILDEPVLQQILVEIIDCIGFFEKKLNF